MADRIVNKWASGKLDTFHGKELGAALFTVDLMPTAADTTVGSLVGEITADDYVRASFFGSWDDFATRLDIYEPDQWPSFVDSSGFTIAWAVVFLADGSADDGRIIAVHGFDPYEGVVGDTLELLGGIAQATDATDFETRLEVVEDAIADLDPGSGTGLPDGGTTGQVLAKVSDDDGDADWVDPSGGGGATGDFTVDLTGETAGPITLDLLSGPYAVPTSAATVLIQLPDGESDLAIIAPDGTMRGPLGVVAYSATEEPITVQVDGTLPILSAADGLIVATLTPYLDFMFLAAKWDTDGGGGSGPDLSDADPLGPGTAAPGTSPDASRADHVHPRQTAIVNSEIDAAANIAQSKVASLTTDLAAKAPTTRTITAGTGLTGGGDLSADRTLTVAYGTSSTTAAVGNDSRLSDARTPSTGGSNDDIMQRKSGAWTNRTPAQVKTDLVLVKGDVGLGNVTNNSQALLSWNPAPTVKASDQSYNSSVVLRDDTALTFAYGAGEVWTGEAILYAYGATGADLAVGIGASTAATLLQAGIVGPASTYAGSAASMQSQGNIVALTTVGGAGFGVFGTGTTAAAGAFVTIKFTFSSASAGTLAIQHCQAVTSATNTVIQAGSSLTMRRSS